MEMLRAVNRSRQPETVLDSLDHLHGVQTKENNHMRLENLELVLWFFSYSLSCNWINSPKSMFVTEGQDERSEKESKKVLSYLKKVAYLLRIEAGGQYRSYLDK